MDRLARKRGPAPRWGRLVLAGVIAAALLAGGSLYLTRGTPASRQAAAVAAGRTAQPGSTAPGCGTAGNGSCAPGESAIAVAASPVLVTIVPRKTASGTDRAKSGASASASATPPPTAGGQASAQPTASASASAPAGTSQDSAAAGQVLALINQARASAGLSALTITSGLETSSSAHNMTMAGGCGLSHQCPGEPAIGDRETAAGVHWTAAGENIGDGGPVGGTSAAVAQLAVALTQSMLDEKPPNDGHRQNILSRTFTHIGIAVYRDGSGTVWLTQDFSN
jgi:uncharacterized protein YkwD